MANESPAAVIHDSSGQERGHMAEHPVFVTGTDDSPGYEWNRLTIAEANQPATVISGNSGPYNIGGTTLTIAVNGTADNQTFASKAATAGVFISGSYPGLNLGTEKLKVSINGGVETEIKIGKNLLTMTAIAASIQTQIRANVANGSNVICEWNSTTYPQRLVVTSGTTGPTSTVAIRKGGDNCALLLKLDTTVGGYAVNGLNANNYHAWEVPGLMDITGVTVLVVSNKIQIETVNLGATASINVTAGGANTAFAFPTGAVYGTTVAGVTNMNVDGSSIPKLFQFTAGAYTFIADKMILRMRADNEDILKNFGNIANGVTNGLKVQVRSPDGELHDWFLAKTNADILSWADSGEVINDAYAANGKDLLTARFVLQPRLTLRGGTLDSIRFTVQDNLTAIDELRVYLLGRTSGVEG